MGTLADWAAAANAPKIVLRARVQNSTHPPTHPPTFACSTVGGNVTGGLFISKISRATIASYCALLRASEGVASNSRSSASAPGSERCIIAGILGWYCRVAVRAGVVWRAAGGG